MSRGRHSNEREAFTQPPCGGGHGNPIRTPTHPRWCTHRPTSHEVPGAPRRLPPVARLARLGMRPAAPHPVCPRAAAATRHHARRHRPRRPPRAPPLATAPRAAACSRARCRCRCRCRLPQRAADAATPAHRAPRVPRRDGSPHAAAAAAVAAEAAARAAPPHPPCMAGACGAVRGGGEGAPGVGGDHARCRSTRPEAGEEKQ